ncbi:MAG: hypothetical protein JWN27_803 [Candidatus Eremiobacteraeota bacterium]|nr:hypothetical protein [Candidatus Eremiobacteraeota bacterium]
MKTNAIDSTRLVPADKLTLPGMGFGYLLGVAFLALEFGEQILDPTSTSTVPTPVGWAIGLAGLGYWLYCVYRFHQALQTVTDGAYPITPLRAALFHFLPLFNIYWLFHWTNTMAQFINARGRAHMGIGWPGFLLLVAIVLKSLDGGLALLMLFAVGAYVSKRLRATLLPYGAS